MTIKDIAKLAQVSVSTVSKILNHKDDDIGEETRKKVLKIVKQYQYTPYSKVREIAVGRSYLFAVILPENLYYKEELIVSIEKYTVYNGYNLMIYFTKTQSDEIKYIQILSGKNIDTILLYPIAEQKESIELLEKQKIPYLVLTKMHQFPQALQVYGNYEKAAYIATKHLIKYGHRKIGLLLHENRHNNDCKEGYMQALFESDILFEPGNVFIGQDEQETGRIGAHQFINRNLSAVVCENEVIACGTYAACERHATRIPKDMSIVCIHTLGFYKALHPKLDIVSLNLHEVGKQAIEMILQKIESKKDIVYHTKEIKPILIQGESVSNPFEKVHGAYQKIIVVGSMNVDNIINVEKLPTDGETLLSNHLAILPGGKGLNQATSTGKLGGLVYAIGSLGNDTDGKKLYHCLVQNGVKTEGIRFSTSLSTGKAYINVAKDGESTIVVYQGANEELDTYQIRQHQKLFQSAQYCLLSLEIPQKTAIYTIKMCHETGVSVFVKPATIETLQCDILPYIDYLIPNEKEIHKIVPGDFSIEQKAEMLYQRGVKNVIVTLGSKGCYIRNEQYHLFFEAAPFEPQDTTGAADAFISAFAVALSEGKDMINAIVFATYAAGISIARLGAQPSMPDRTTIDLYQTEIMEKVSIMKQRVNCCEKE
ncbi:PfkB family carbohydrate kinase [Lachnospiraceae bacterium 46-61]